MTNIVPTVLIMALAFFIGATVYSYLNIIIEKMQKEEPVFKGRNFANCLKPHKKREVAIAIFGGILTAVVFWYYHVSLAAVTVFLVYAVLTVITFIDADTQIIPPQLNITIFVLGVLSIWTLPGPNLLERVIGIFSIALPLFLIVLVVPDGFGGGDIKMMAAAGFLLGWKGNVLAFFIGLLFGGTYGIYLLIGKKADKKAHFAFGPFLSVGVAVSLFGQLGTYLMNQYLNMILAAWRVNG